LFPANIILCHWTLFTMLVTCFYFIFLGRPFAIQGSLVYCWNEETAFSFFEILLPITDGVYMIWAGFPTTKLRTTSSSDSVDSSSVAIIFLCVSFFSVMPLSLPNPLLTLVFITSIGLLSAAWFLSLDLCLLNDYFDFCFLKVT
jgi:hypothetical protein